MNTVFHLLKRWLYHIGDTTFWSWVITVLYLVVIILAFFYRRKIKDDKPRHFLWSAIFFFLLAMGINKQLDFQTLFILSGRWLARRLEFLEYRRIVFRYMGYFLVLLATTVTLLVLIKARSALLKEKTAVLGTSILMLFTLIRVGTTSHIGKARLLQHIIHRIHALELLGLLVIQISLLMNLKRIKRSHPK